MNNGTNDHWARSLFQKQAAGLKVFVRNFSLTKHEKVCEHDSYRNPAQNNSSVNIEGFWLTIYVKNFDLFFMSKLCKPKPGYSGILGLTALMSFGNGVKKG